MTRVAQRKMLLYDKAGEEHFNLISALHKSLRESDADAALYWLARMLEAGEDPAYLARRDAALRQRGRRPRRPAGRRPGARRPGSRTIGWARPEGELALAQAVVYLALAPKSIARLPRPGRSAARTVAERPAEPVPLAIRNAPTGLMKRARLRPRLRLRARHRKGVGGLDCLPDALRGRRFYRPDGRGFEERLARRLSEIDELRRKARHGEGDG